MPPPPPTRTTSIRTLLTPKQPLCSSLWDAHVRLERAVRCGRKKCVEFILWRMGADTEIPDYGGFTPLLNTGKSSHATFSSPKAEERSNVSGRTLFSSRSIGRPGTKPGIFLARKRIVYLPVYPMNYTSILSGSSQNIPVCWIVK